MTLLYDLLAIFILAYTLTRGISTLRRAEERVSVFVTWTWVAAAGGGLLLLILLGVPRAVRSIGMSRLSEITLGILASAAASAAGFGLAFFLQKRVGSR